MILLTVITVGLLSLSSISLRTSAQAGAMSAARSNARLALMLAIGELQETAGPDKAVTAASEILGETPAKPNLTGVWDSWDFDVKNSNLDYNSPKTQPSEPGTSPGFKGWLVSDGNFQNAATRDYPNSPFTEKESIELVGTGSLGADAVAADKVRAGKVIIRRGGKETGAFAWHVADESLKARINTYRDLSANPTLSQKRGLLAGHRPDVSVMENSKQTKLGFLPDDTTDYAGALASTGKVISLNQVELLNNTPTIKSFRNDVTPYSLGLLTNVREGGLKQDLTSLFEMTTNGTSGTTGLPSGFNGKKIYQTSVYSGGTGVTGVSDPYWTALAGYYNTYKELVSADSSPKLAKIPAENITLTSLVQPRQYATAPVIAKVELLFSFIVRDKHGPWKGNPGDYEGHLLYTPVITLHNPYNVSLQFDKMKVGMIDVPMGLRFYVNGAPQNGMTPMASFFKGTAAGKKEFWMELGDWPSATATQPSAPIVMKPGQTMVFGPYINAGEPFGDDNASYSDFGNNKTGQESSPMKSKRGFAGANVGFDVDWLKGAILNVNKADQIAIEFKSLAPPGGSSFKVSASLTSKGVTKTYGGLNFTYGAQTILDKILPDTLRYPKQNGIVAESMHVPNSVAPGNIGVGSPGQAKAFALFSAYARTANGGVDATGSRVHAAKVALPDGRLAGNPFLHNNPARVAISTDLTKEKAATQSHELNLELLNGTTDDAFIIASDFRTNYLLNYKQVSGRSIKSGSYLEIPSGPLQAIADFRRSNVLASPFLPAFVQPIGNSYASPLLSTENVVQTGVAAYALLDHSVLANHALYDRTYFSTFAPVNGVAASGAFMDFIKDGKPLRSQLFQGYLPAGKTAEEAKDLLFGSNGKPAADAYQLAAEFQMVKGPFNVNSTRVQAWKAMLSSMKHTELQTLWTKSGALASTPSKGVPLPAMTLHNGSATNGSFGSANMDDPISNEWNGYREFTDAEIETLANRIVDQVRLRGPFQSMSEFVNRRIGSNSELTRMGALQNAIEESKLNDSVYKDGQVTVKVNESDVSNTDLYNFKTPAAAAGNPAAGAPGWLSQADLLKVLEPAATVRADTFVIRACGEATDGTGKVLAKAYVEAVVQRIPEYVNASDAPSATVPNPNAPSGTDATLVTAPENLAFGRKFVVVSFRWLSANEI